ncbi:glycosyltransferase family 2 protein [Providencia huaxiensis]|uniref:glycosyltransferase family 2 protein n=1 Tax=Providencia huaxiensis TaxID=2027290 RepID=UPI00333217BE
MVNNDLSVIILTFNEEVHISRCIKSLQKITPYIYIIDSYSTDNTVNIARTLGAKIFQNKWPGNHAAQFQWALDNCNLKTTWAMKMDADEYIIAELITEINQNLPRVPDDVSGIYLKRRVYFKGRWIKHGGYYPTKLLRIWKLKHGSMEQRLMDEHIKLSEGNSIEFTYDIIDDNKNDLTWWSIKHVNYATREVADILNRKLKIKEQKEIKPKWFGTQEQFKRKIKNIYLDFPLFIRPFIYFIHRFFFKLGFLDGKEGLIWHILQGFWYRFLVDAKIYELSKEIDINDPESVKNYLLKKHGINFEN